jgi:iron complex transport system permease protein
MFVGLAAPHLARLLIGHQIGRLMVGSAVIGSLFVLIADVLARVLHQTSEVPLSVVLGLIGAPALILLLRRAVTR